MILKVALIVKPPFGSLGLEINNDYNARYTGARVSHVEEDSPADGSGLIHKGTLLEAGVRWICCRAGYKV